MSSNIVFHETKTSKTFLVALAVSGLMILAGLASAYYMEHNGHWVTGMDNQIVWGLPHVFAVFLIIAASGALNVASISTVFNKPMYKSLARLSGLVSITLLAGGLGVLLLDLGRPDRLIVAMTSYNFKSIFAWNVILYSGFMLITGIYLWFMMHKPMESHYPKAGFAAFIWRLILTTGTGSIFGFLVARQAYNSAVIAPMFIIMSFAAGLAIYILSLIAMCAMDDRPLGDAIIQRLKNLLIIFIGAVFYFVLIYHLTNIYQTQDHGMEKFFLVEGGYYTTMFWVVQIGLGIAAPLLLLSMKATGHSRFWIAISCFLVLLGGLAHMYLIIIGGQAWPLEMFPGKEVSSSFYDGVVNYYSPSIAELFLGLGGVGVAIFLTLFVSRVLRFLPESLSDEVVDPHHPDNH